MKLQKGLLIVQIDNTIFGSWVKIIIHVLYKGNEKVAKEKIRIHRLILTTSTVDMSYFKEVWFACAILLSPSCSLPALLESVGATFLTQLIFASA